MKSDLVFDAIRYYNWRRQKSLKRGYALNFLLGAGDRDCRILIHKANADGFCICNLGNGYFVPDKQNPVDRARVVQRFNQEHNRAMSILSAETGMKNFFKECPGQYEYDLKTGNVKEITE